MRARASARGRNESAVVELPPFGHRPQGEKRLSKSTNSIETDRRRGNARGVIIGDLIKIGSNHLSRETVALPYRGGATSARRYAAQNAG